MELHDDSSAAKDRILDDIGKAIKLLHQQQLQPRERKGVAAHVPCPASASVVAHLDAGLRHGLREQRHGYWELVAGVSHSETRRALSSISSPTARGRAWVQLVLSEGSLRSHLQCVLSDKEVLVRHYGDRALLRDHSRSQLLMRLAGAADAVAGGLLRSHHTEDSEEHQKPVEAEPSRGSLGIGAIGPDPSMMASVTSSSLASPVDSGVALLDSDSEATTANGEPDDGSSLREVEAAFHDVEGTTPTPALTCAPRAAVVDSCSSPMVETPVGSESSCEAFVYPQDSESVQDTVERQVLNEIARRFKESNSPRKKMEKNSKSSLDHSTDTNKMGEPIMPVDNDKLYMKEKNSGIINTEESLGHDNETKNNEKNRIYHSPDNKELEAANEADGIVFRRHRRRHKGNVDQGSQKRVSFHGDVGGSPGSQQQARQFSASFMPPHPIMKNDVVPGRYSWCAEGDAPFVERRDGGAGGTHSDMLLVSSSSSVAANDSTEASSEEKRKAGSSTDSLKVSEERGMPEGREDPPRPAGVDGAAYRAAAAGLTPAASCSALLTMDDSAIAAAAAAAGSRGGCFVLSASLAKFASMASSIDYWSSDEADGDDLSFLDKRQSMLSVASSAPSLKARINQRRLTALSQKPSKAPLLQRFMRSLAGSPSRRPSLRGQLGGTHSASSAVFPRLPCPVPAPPLRGAKCPEKSALAAADATFAAEMRVLAAQKIAMAAAEAALGPPGDVELDREAAQKAFSLTVFCRPTETLYKVYKVSSSYWAPDRAGPRPLLLLLTDWGVYVCGLRANLTYCAVLALAYRDLHTIIAGPRLQTLILVPDPVTHPLPPLALATPDNDSARSLLCHLDVAARRATASHKVPLGPRARLLRNPVVGGLPAPAVAEVSADDMARLKAQLDVDKILHYALVRVQDEQLSPPSTPLGPQRQGYLMARTAEEESWVPGYFILKAGVLYQFADQSQRLPLRALMLGGGHCLRARRLASVSARPHSFELCTAADVDVEVPIDSCSRQMLQMAAADEYEASEWLQALVQAASGLYEVERTETVPCSVVLTPSAVVTCREHWWPRWVGIGSPGGGAESRHGRAETLARAPLTDITSVTVATDSDSWCILEFSCREVHATSGDWVLYFASPNEMVAFREALRSLWMCVSKKEFPLRSRLEEGLHRRCVETSLQLAAAWDQLLPFG